MKQFLAFHIFILLTLSSYSQGAFDLTREYISTNLKGKTSAETIEKLDKYPLGRILESCSEALNDSSKLG